MPKFTPMMEQYFEIKKEYAHCILFFRLGDFYEMFFEDAVLASKELDLTLTGRDCGQPERAPMCGVPYHAADSYINRLVQKGFRVAVCEQTEDPKLSKSIVKREVVRVVSSGTTTDSAILEEDKNNYILSVFQNSSSFGLSSCDISTGEFQTTVIDTEKSLIDEVAKYRPSEIIVNNAFTHSSLFKSIFGISPETYNEWCFEYNNAYLALKNHFNVLNLRGLGIEEKPDAVSSSGALIAYLLDNQKNRLKHINKLRFYQISQYMVLDPSSRKNLEITENARERGKRGSLLWVLDNTKTPMGARKLRRWLQQPLRDAGQVNKRLDSVCEFVNFPLDREEIREYLGTVKDMERLLGKLSTNNANAGDLRALKNSLKNMPHVKETLVFAKSEFVSYMYNNFDTLTDVYEEIDSTVREDPSVNVKEGGFIKPGADEGLDRLYEIKEQGSGWLAGTESEEREKTGIKNLKIKFSKIFGYCFEVTNSYKNMAPDYFIRRQTLSNCERYTTEALKKIEEDILSADEKIKDLEYTLFCRLRGRILEQTDRITKQAEIISTLDCIQSLAAAAEKMKYVKPQVDTSGVIDIKGGRHPVLEAMMKQPFIPNDTILDCDENRLSIITGPNMAGKSTYMRQTAIIVLMAQIGSFVPADSARIGTVDRIFTRVGASDDLLTGQSTFMVEMCEVANILNCATADSLLILDEIGRGTSTYDGLSIAWAVMEYIADKSFLGAKTLFATHYHELTELEGKIDGAKNYCVTVEHDGENIVFLRKIARGGAVSSYGIHAAKLAGMPECVIARSGTILGALNSADITKNKDTPQGIEVYYSRPIKKDKNKNRLIINEILSDDVDNMTPVQALKRLSEIQVILREIL